MYGKKMANGGKVATKAAEVKKREQRMHKGKKPMKMADGGCVPGTTGTGRRLMMDGAK